MKLIVVLFGRAQSGKGTVAAAMLHEARLRGMTRVELQFSAGVKETAIALTGMPREVAFGGQAEREAWTYAGRNAREWLQVIGTEYGRDVFGPTHWRDRVAQQIRESQADVVVVSDGRFANEADLVVEGYETRTVWIERPGHEIPESSHASENSWPERFDWTIFNDGSEEKLWALATHGLETFLDNLGQRHAELAKPVKRGPKVYVAGPMSQGDLMAHVAHAAKVAGRLADAGARPFVPQLSALWHLVAPRPYEDWIALDLGWIEECDYLLRLVGESPGADREVSHALDLGLSVFREGELDELIDEIRVEVAQ